MTRTIAILTVIGTLLAACGSDGTNSSSGTTPPTPTTSQSDTSAPPDASDGTDDAAGTGTIAVHIEEVDGFFIEGFEVGLRFETADGEVLGSTLWSDFVVAEGDGTLESFYDSVLEQPVPAGDVVVFAAANVGAGPPPETPDLEGNLPCRLDLTVADGERIDVDVTFADTDACLVVR